MEMQKVKLTGRTFKIRGSEYVEKVKSNGEKFLVPSDTSLPAGFKSFFVPYRLIW